jgi:hypothetical protein
MISPVEFRERWSRLPNASPLLTLPPSAAPSLHVPESTKEFLLIGGLPKSAAPYMGFEEVE